MDGSDATSAAEGAEFFDQTSLLDGTTESNVAETVDLLPAEVAATFSDITEVNIAVEPLDSTVAVSATTEAADESDDPLTLFSWTLRYRANSDFGNGQYEVRLILGADPWIRSGNSADALMTLARAKAAEVVKKLES